MQEIKRKKLTNFEIKKQIDKWGKEYFIIVNNDDQEAYFCFEKMVKKGWGLLSTHPNSIIIEYEENEQNNRIYKRVVSIEKI